MRARHILGWSLFLFLCFPVLRHPLCAADFAPIPSEEMKINEVPGMPGAPAIVLFHEQINDDLKHSKTIYYRIKVLTEAGRSYADVEIPYDRRSFQLIDVKGRTIRPDGTIVPFTGKPFEKDILKAGKTRIKETVFTLPDVQVGSILEYRFTLIYYDQSLYAAQWMIQRELFQKRVHFRFNYYSGDVQNGHGETMRGVAWTWNLPPNLKVVEKQQQRPSGTSAQVNSAELEASDIPAFVEEDHMPPASAFKYNVHFYYTNNIKTDVFWKKEGKYWNKEIDKFLDNQNALRNQVGQVVKPEDSPEQKVRKIYDYVTGLENLTYRRERTFAELQALGLDKSRQAQDVMRLKAGDRDELTRLFVGLVREAGIPAWLIRVTDRSETIFLPNYLDWRQLDMEVAIVKLGDKEMYLDPGTRFCPFGSLNWKLNSSKGVRQSATGKDVEIANTPDPDYTDAKRARVGAFRLNDEGKIEGTLRITWEGQEALSRRLEGALTDDEGRQKMLENEIKEWLPDTAEISLANTPAWEASGAPLVAQFKITSPMLTSAGRRLLLPGDPLAFNRRAMFSSAKRSRVVYFNYPYIYSDEIKFTLPDSVSVETLPAAQDMKPGYAFYASAYKRQEKTIVMNRVLALGGIVFTVEEYPGLKDFYDKVKTYDDQQIILTRGAGNAAAK